MNRRRVAAAVAAVLLVAAACGSSDVAETGEAPPTSPDATSSDAEAVDEPDTEPADEADTEPADEPDAEPADEPDADPVPGNLWIDPESSDDIPDSIEVELTTIDGETLQGTLFVGGRAMSDTAVVLGHMRGASQSTWFDFAAQLADAGYSALAFDSRGYGLSTGERDSDLDVDLASAVERLRAEGAGQVVVMGASMNATAALVTASEVDLAGVVSLSAPGEFLGLDAVDAAPGIDEPALIVVAEDDNPYAEVAPDLAEASGGTIVVFDGSAHGTGLFGDHGDELSQLLLDFVAELDA